MLFSNVLWRVIGDGVVCVAFLIFSMLAVYTDLIFNPFKRGFFCEDTAIKQPFLEAMFDGVFFCCLFLLVPAIVLLVYEASYYFFKKGTRDMKMFYVVFSEVVVFIFGFCAMAILVQVVRCVAGRLRPHFFAICGPDIECSTDTVYSFVGNYTCVLRDEDDKTLRFSRLSFPSISSSMSAFGMVYLALYLQYRMTYKGIYFVRHTIQLILVSLGFAAALSRYLDNLNHLEDVVAGFAIGTASAVLTFFVLCPNRRTADEPSESEIDLIVNLKADSIRNIE